MSDGKDNVAIEDQASAGMRLYKPDPAVIRDVMNRFTYHTPKGDQVNRYGLIRDSGREMAMRLINLCPQSRELSLALTKLEEAVMHANAAIARNE